MVQKTAVEFVIEKYEKFINSENGSGEAYFYDQLLKDIEQAIQMEKEQIVNANDVGFEEGHKHTKSNYTFFPKDGLQYYNETYNK